MKLLITICLVLTVLLAGCASNLVSAASDELPNYKTLDLKEARGIIEITVDGYTYEGKYSEERLQCTYLYSRDSKVQNMYKCHVSSDSFILVEIMGEQTNVRVTGPFAIPIN